MSRMFCTLKEAAATLHASEDQIQTLLERGILHEFREGPHRLLKEADVGALASVGERRAHPQPPAPLPDDGRQRTEDAGRRTERQSPPFAGTRPPRAMPGRSSGAPRRRGEVPERRPCPSPPRLSVRQWFWIGLIQDRPLVIALLSGLVLLGLSALAAGLCFVAETF
jgi:hypothetical protein